MRSVRFLTDSVDDALVSTVFIEPFGYYETAIVRGGYSNRNIELVDSNIVDAEVAAELHSATVQGLRA